MVLLTKKWYNNTLDATVGEHKYDAILFPYNEVNYVRIRLIIFVKLAINAENQQPRAFTNSSYI